MRTSRALKTFVYLIGVASVFVVAFSINEMSKIKPTDVKNKLFQDIGNFPHSGEDIPDDDMISSDADATPGNTKLLKADVKENRKTTPKYIRELVDKGNGTKVNENLILNDKGIIKEKHTRRVYTATPIPRKSLNNVITRAPTYTFAEFKQKAREDNMFLLKILTQSYLHPKSRDVLRRYFLGTNYSFEPEFKSIYNVSLQRHFDINYDVMVFLHIQKTGGTYFNEKLFRYLHIPFKCNCPAKFNTCKCLNPKGNAWIYTSKLSGWPCGLHADWTQLHRCIPGKMDEIEGKQRNRRYFYFTQLREPFSRYLSEYFHQSAIGGHWQDALLGCGPGFSDWADIRPCFHTESWKGVKLDEFLACPHNLATNRMTRMLADLNKSNCYTNYLSRKAMLFRAVKWVDSAKENLQLMEYFGLMEDEWGSDGLFSSVFKMTYSGKQKKYVPRTSNIKMTEAQFLHILRNIELDIHIYLFAKDLFDKRLRSL